MLDRLRHFGVLLTSAALALGCGDNTVHNVDPDASLPPDSGPGADSGPDTPDDPTDPAGYTAPDGEKLAFGVQEGNIRNYFFRQGPVAVHLLTRSGTQPRVVAAFPAGNQGIGIWFDDVTPGVELQAAGDITTGGDVEGVIRPATDARKAMHGVRTTLSSGATSLTVKLTLLANVRTVRDYGYGYDFTQAPELTNNEIQLIAEHNVVRVSRAQIGEEYHMEYLLKGVDGTMVEVEDDTITLSSPSGVKLDIFLLSDDEPLTPITTGNLLKDTPEDSFELNALAFLTYAEKLQAGSWRFLTYFGRDTLLSVRMLMPALQPEVVEAALTSVIERINLIEGLPDPHFDYVVEVGDVAHEEELADYAAWKNSKETEPPADLRTPRYDYKMVDDDFLLAPVLARYYDEYPERAIEFLGRTRELDGVSYRMAVEKNLQLILDRAAPYAGTSREPLKLVSLKNSVPVGEWRDSLEGLGFGRYAFNVNVALVPAALEGARALYLRLGDAEKSVEAGDLLDGWADIDEHFLISVPEGDAQDLVATYAEGVELDRTVAEEIDGDLEYYAVSLDAEGTPVPIMHTDHGFVMLFTNPSETYLARMARSIARTFPAGLLSDVGIIVASAALAGETTVQHPFEPTEHRLVDLFTNSHYHGSVVWSWQQAMLAAGIRRQLAEREDLSGDTRGALEAAECKLWDSIIKANAVRAGELWTWEAVDGKPEYRFFGYNRSDVDESNAAQLWSTVYLVVKPPADYAIRCMAD